MGVLGVGFLLLCSVLRLLLSFWWFLVSYWRSFSLHPGPFLPSLVGVRDRRDDKGAPDQREGRPKRGATEGLQRFLVFGVLCCYVGVVEGTTVAPTRERDERQGAGRSLLRHHP